MKDIVRFALLIGLIVASGVGPAGGRQGGSAARVVHIAAERFEFVPAEINAQEGEALELRLTSLDTIHGFRLVGPDGTSSDVAIPKRGRGEVRVRFEATAAGRYTFECSRLCGAGHGFMRGTIKVKPRDSQGAGS